MSLFALRYNTIVIALAVAVLLSGGCQLKPVSAIRLNPRSFWDDKSEYAGALVEVAGQLNMDFESSTFSIDGVITNSDFYLDTDGGLAVDDSGWKKFEAERRDICWKQAESFGKEKGQANWYIRARMRIIAYMDFAPGDDHFTGRDGIEMVRKHGFGHLGSYKQRLRLVKVLEYKFLPTAP